MADLLIKDYNKLKKRCLELLEENENLKEENENLREQIQEILYWED